MKLIRGHKSLSASLAFLPIRAIRKCADSVAVRSQKPFGFFGISAEELRHLIEREQEARVTKAFRLLWHLGPKNLSPSVVSGMRSQKPFGFFGISADNLKYFEDVFQTKMSQKPFGFFGISALCTDVIHLGPYEGSHKVFPASFASLPMICHI